MFATAIGRTRLPNIVKPFLVTHPVEMTFRNNIATPKPSAVSRDMVVDDNTLVRRHDRRAMVATRDIF
jgi:hypothetical protein